MCCPEKGTATRWCLPQERQALEGVAARLVRRGVSQGWVFVMRELERTFGRGQAAWELPAEECFCILFKKATMKSTPDLIQSITLPYSNCLRVPVFAEGFENLSRSSESRVWSRSPRWCGGVEGLARSGTGLWAPRGMENLQDPFLPGSNSKNIPALVFPNERRAVTEKPPN